MRTIELAYLFGNQEFMAHRACQKWITRKLYSEIIPRNLSYGFFKCSDYFKVNKKKMIFKDVNSLLFFMKH